MPFDSETSPVMKSYLFVYKARRYGGREGANQGVDDGGELHDSSIPAAPPGHYQQTMTEGSAPSAARMAPTN